MFFGSYGLDLHRTVETADHLRTLVGRLELAASRREDPPSTAGEKEYMPILGISRQEMRVHDDGEW